VHFLYKITNLINDKNYIGQTKNPKARWTRHKSSYKFAIHKAIRKYGSNNFIFDIIATCKNQNDANELEILLIEQYQSHISTGRGYNMSKGGGFCQPEDYASRKGKKLTKEHKIKLSISKTGALNPNYGKPSPKAFDLTQKQIDIIKTNQHSQRELAKMFGVSRSKIATTQKEYNIDPKLGAEFIKGRSINQTSFQRGHKLSETSRKKISIANLGKPSPKKINLSQDQIALILSSNHTQKELTKLLNISTTVIKRIKREYKKC
jgi:group I intron endonuclease